MKRIKLELIEGWVLLGILFVLPMAAEAGLVAISNPSFESPVTASATFSGGQASGPTGWAVYNSGATSNERFFGVWNPSTTSSFVSGAPEGANVGVVFLENTTNLAEAGLEQVLVSTLELSMRYTLTVEVGNFAPSVGSSFDFTGFPGYRVELFAGSTLIASDLNTLSPSEGFFETSVVSFTTGSSHANAGEALAIRLVNLNGPGIEVNFDHVRLDVSERVFYVSTNSLSDGPGTSWANAFHTIQGGVDAASSGDVVLVSNGVYSVGTRVTPFGGALLNRVVLDEGVDVRSVNGAGVTIIEGAEATGGGNGPDAVRGVYMQSGSSLRGFTVRSGHTMASGDVDYDQDGGGAYLDGVGAGLFDCVLVGNSAFDGGGGVSRGNLYRCSLVENVARVFGGGSSSSFLNDCLVEGNMAQNGGGTHGGGLENCTVVGNTASDSGGGVYFSSLKSCVVYLNTAGSNNNWQASFPDFSHTCTTPLPLGVGNITNVPQFVDVAATNFHLRFDSPCIDAGDLGAVVGTNDLDGLARVVNGLVDMGAYEYPWPDSDGDGMPDRFEWLNGGDTTNLVAGVDGDGDGSSNLEEWEAGTSPTNGASVLEVRIEDVLLGSDYVVEWDAVPGRVYRVLWSSDLTNAFGVIASGLEYPQGVYTDVVHGVENRGYYRMEVESP